jgi:hypothetical protein
VAATLRHRADRHPRDRGTTASRACAPLRPGAALPLTAQDRRGHGRTGARLLDLTGIAGPDALLDERYGLLFLHTWPQDAASVFSLQPGDQRPQPCR